MRPLTHIASKIALCGAMLLPIGSMTHADTAGLWLNACTMPREHPSEVLDALEATGYEFVDAEGATLVAHAYAEWDFFEGIISTLWLLQDSPELAQKLGVSVEASIEKMEARSKKNTSNFIESYVDKVAFWDEATDGAYTGGRMMIRDQIAMSVFPTYITSECRLFWQDEKTPWIVEGLTEDFEAQDGTDGIVRLFRGSKDELSSELKVMWIVRAKAQARFGFTPAFEQAVWLDHVRLSE